MTKFCSIEVALEMQITKYDMVFRLWYTSVGLLIGQIWQNHILQCQEELRKLLCAKKFRRELNAANEPNDIQKFISKLCLVGVFGTDWLALFDKEGLSKII